MNWQHIAQEISTITGQSFQLGNHASVGGGCINSAYRISGSNQEYFVKTNVADKVDMFEAEADGLRELATANAIRVPMPICSGVVDNQSYIVMEYIPFSGRGGGKVMAEFGEQLAQLHRHTSDRFGWYRDNTIGATHQPNDWEANWLQFWHKHRLGYQINMAARHGIGARTVKKGEQLLARLDEFYAGYQPQASLLHGDLWSGNYAISDHGEPVIFDPAVYYGDREADIAMTELFGAFGSDFYAAYNASWPLDAGYRLRKTFYNLYHIINHFNMFGGGYGSQADGMLDRLLAEIR